MKFLKTLQRGIVRLKPIFPSLIFLLALLSNLIAPKIEELKYAREVFIFQRMWPELTCIFLLYIIFLLRGRFLPYLLLSINKIKNDIRCGDLKKVIFILLFIAAILLLFWFGIKGVLDYGRARHKYIFDETYRSSIQREFRAEQLFRATDFEFLYQYGKARDIYESILKIYPSDDLNDGIKRRISLIDGLFEYSRQLERLYLKATAEGDQRKSYFLLAERLRVFPLADDVAKKLELNVELIEKNLAEMGRFENSCRSGADIKIDNFNNKLHFGFENEIFSKNNSLSESENLKAACKLLLRFPDSDSALAMMRLPWQLRRIKSTLEYAKNIRGGGSMKSIFNDSGS